MIRGNPLSVGKAPDTEQETLSSEAFSTAPSHQLQDIQLIEIKPN